MIRGIDHVIIATPDPAAAAAELEDRLGVVATGGGSHEGTGTHNRLVFLADGAYIELIGVADAEAVRRHPLGIAILDALDQRGGGYVGFALVTDRIESLAASLVAADSELSPPAHGSRRRPDGELVEWWAAFPPRVGPDGLPFLIQHLATGAEWSPAALAERATFAHPIGSPAMLVRLDIATDDPPAIAAEYHRQLGLEFWAVADLAVASVGHHAIRLVPRREMPVPAVLTMGAEVDDPRTVEALGVRFDVERVALPLPAPNRA